MLIQLFQIQTWWIFFVHIFMSHH